MEVEGVVRIQGLDAICAIAPVSRNQSLQSPVELLMDTLLRVE